MGIISCPGSGTTAPSRGLPKPADVRHRDARLTHTAADPGTENLHNVEPAALAERCAELQQRVAQLQTALDSRVIIEQAKGVLAERHGLGVDSAFELLRSHARRNHLRIHDLARAVVNGPRLASDEHVAD